MYRIDDEKSSYYLFFFLVSYVPKEGRNKNWDLENRMRKRERRDGA